MHSADGRWVLSYNGEVYNAQALRTQIKSEAGIDFRGGSDTEVVLEAIALWGLNVALHKFIGMFAFALWDRRLRNLHLVRDRLGIKPLFMARTGDAVVFSSELHGVIQSGLVAREIDRSALSDFLLYRYVPSPASILRNVVKIEPATIVTIDESGSVSKTKFWDLESFALVDIPLQSLPEGEAVERLETLIDDAVSSRLVSDVPLGAFLSGGIDSTLVVATMQAASRRPIKTFTIGFESTRHDEAPFAAAIASHIGTDHTEFRATASDALDCVEMLGTICDEPFADSSLLPTYLVSKLARSHVTVSLSGDGGDESFAGYNRYSGILKVARLAEGMPRSVRAAMAGTIGCVPAVIWDKMLPIIRRESAPRQASQQIEKLLRILRCDDAVAMYMAAMTDWVGQDIPVLDGGDDSRGEMHERMSGWNISSLRRMQLADSLTYLPDDILTKVDRASMAVSLEARVPLLDHRIVEFAWSLPDDLKMRDGTGKWLLRKLLSKKVPSELWDRPKKGFSVPLAEWLRGELKDWTYALLDPVDIEQQGLLDGAVVARLLDMHQTGKADNAEPLWSLLMFQQWYRCVYCAPLNAVGQLQ